MVLFILRKYSLIFFRVSQRIIVENLKCYYNKPSIRNRIMRSRNYDPIKIECERACPPVYHHPVGIIGARRRAREFIRRAVRIKK